jgi:hypothetical protein
MEMLAAGRGLQRALATAGALALLGAGMAAAHARIPHPTRAEQGERFVPRPEVARLLAFGFHPVVANAYWMQAVQVVGGAQGNPVDHAALLARLIDVVTTVDPWVGHPYRFAANFLIDTDERVRFANTLLERGIAHQPDDWRNWFYLGFNHFFYLKDNAAAADAMEQAAALPGAPLYLKRLVARLRSESAGLETAQQLLEQMLRDAEDPAAQQQFEDALREIETERRARILDAARERFQARAGRDIRSVEELVSGPFAVLERLPEEPNGAAWKLEPITGKIESTHYEHRYGPVFISEEYRASGVVEVKP